MLSMVLPMGNSAQATMLLPKKKHQYHPRKKHQKPMQIIKERMLLKNANKPERD